MVLSPSVLCSFRRHLKHDETCRHSSAHRQGKWSQGKDGELQSFPPTNMAVCATAFEYFNLSGVSVGLQITQKCSLDKTFILKSPYNLLKWPPNGLGRWHTHCVQAPKSTHEHTLCEHTHMPILHTYKDYKTIAEVSLVSDKSAHLVMTITLRTALSWGQNRPHNSCKAP